MARFPDGWIFLTKLSNKALTIDVTEKHLVKCKHCKHYKPYKGRVSGITYFNCEVLEQDTEPEWFCADGEEPEDERNHDAGTADG